MQEQEASGGHCWVTRPAVELLMDKVSGGAGGCPGGLGTPISRAGCWGRQEGQPVTSEGRWDLRPHPRRPRLALGLFWRGVQNGAEGPRPVSIQGPCDPRRVSLSLCPQCRRRLMTFVH